jgi:hypothetical protein
MPAARRPRKLRLGAPSRFARNGWLRAAALAVGIAILLGHIYNPGHPVGTTSWFPPDWGDIGKHSGLLALFGLLYRLSWSVPVARPRANTRPAGIGANLAAILFCSGWGAICEIMQLGIYGRQFSPIELGVNTITPIIVIAAISIISWDNYRP